MKHAVSLICLLLVCYFTVPDTLSAEQPLRTTSPPAAPPPGPSILSIIPAQAEPGAKVVLFGAAFGDSATVFLGSVEVQSSLADGKRAEFRIPLQLEPGIYALYIRRSDGAIGRPYNFTVMPLRPVLSALSPDRVSSCAQGRERDVIAQGQNFTNTSRLFFDGAAIRSEFVSSEAITFNVPQVSGGLRQIQIRNGPDNSSVPVALALETKPEVRQVIRGNESVNYYELVIQGNNFDVHSSLMVDGLQIGGKWQNPAEREKLIYLDCTKLIYQRHPYSPVNKDFRLQVINPGGEGSQVVTVTAP
ncbi:MAG: IPT/TIG domain-containing protein [Desulfuromonadales bacterium]